MEEFRDLYNYYSISNEGRVKSKRSGKILKTHSDSKNKGYEYITLNYNGVKKTYQVHRLVAKLFLPIYTVKSAGGFKFSWVNN